MFETPPTIREPSKAEVEAYAERHFIGLSDEELDAMWEYAKTVVDDTAILDELEQPSPPRADYADRDPGYKPGEAEDPHNIYVTKCLVESDNTGPLSGYDVGIKDNIAVAGVEMTCGSKSMEGYVPSLDATLVKRLLDAGASITGKLNMGEFGGSGSGELSAFGPILIPDHPNHLAGGSSGGSAAAVASGEVDVAIGADQAGSIRIPGALCGVVGLKPTHGLVPYTGAAGWGHSFDHAGPMSDSVADSARVLETIAGADPFDPRQSHVETQNYTEHLDRDIDEFSIGVLKEGFGHDVSDPAVDDTVRAAVDHMEDRGAEVEEISIPLHEHAPSIWFAMVMGSSTTLFHTEGVGRFGKGYYDAQFAQAFGKARRTMADEWSICVKTQMVLGEYLEKEYLGRYHAKAQNLRLPLTRQFDEALDDVDAIVMPTMPVTAHEVEADLTLPEVIDRAWSIFPNTPTNDLTGHPAITVPCGTVDGLPVGLQITGGTFDDATVLALADAFERSIE